jgi:alanine racemase
LRAKVHLNVDTGMGRLGVLPGRAIELLREIRSSSHLELCGTMTHVSAPDGAFSASTVEQGRLFESVLREAREQDLLRGWIHMANSASIFTDLRPRYDTVRPGISAYGILPPDLPGAGDLRPVMSLKSQVVFLKDIPRGAPVGYASTWRAENPTRIATLPVGYNDGVPWRVANRGEVLVRGVRAPIVGRVSMDYITIDVGHIRGVKVGDTVTLIGSDGGQSIGVEELAAHAGTIAYEITCSVGKRVRRTYVGGSDIELPRQLAAGAADASVAWRTSTVVAARAWNSGSLPAALAPDLADTHDRSRTPSSGSPRAGTIDVVFRAARARDDSAPPAT